ncbi:NAD(P)/FAD-dependent oxidoreductase [Amycolatopsis sp. CA-230715]|uniref:NAD(P)/FAD-dependent oxidoreductase n=1 Tax=Amycolatopsis sp. CA-230715 TaxID=2745196 RepID=UPI001C010A94|nr:FAD-dependent oxidoreductase [Amycolatopsis sp. CA-230715]
MSAPDVTAPADRAGLGFWLAEQSDEDLTPGTPLDGDAHADVVIVGGGYTGLWIAYYLTEFAPQAKIVVLEAQQAGFGASGRNGGWCTAEMPSLLTTLVARHGPMAAMRMYRAARATLDEIERVLGAEEIDGGWRRDGSFYVARTKPQLDRLRAWRDGRAQLGITDFRLLDADEIADAIAVRGASGIGFTPHCAAVHPARLALGLARAVRRRGVTIAERTTVTAVRDRAVVTEHGTVHAKTVLLATEGYSGGLAGRTIVPLRSHAIATAPLGADVFERLRWRGAPTVTDSRYQFCYLNRTPDDRIVIGGRGVGYLLGSRLRTRASAERAVHTRLLATLTDLFDDLGDVRITHIWSGVYGLQRDSEPSVVFDKETGRGYAGGYGGEGIVLSNLAGRTMAALVTGTRRPETKLCWNGRVPGRWEPEPVRYAGIRGIAALATMADLFEDRTDRTAPLAQVIMKSVV